MPSCHYTEYIPSLGAGELNVFLALEQVHLLYTLSWRRFTLCALPWSRCLEGLPCLHAGILNVCFALAQVHWMYTLHWWMSTERVSCVCQVHREFPLPWCKCTGCVLFLSAGALNLYIALVQVHWMYALPWCRCTGCTRTRASLSCTTTNSTRS